MDDDAGGFEGQIAAFAPRQELAGLRGQLGKLQEQLDSAVDNEEYVVAAMLRDDLAELKSKDPAAMSAVLRKEMTRHVEHERYTDAATCRDQLMVLRRFLPQYQLAGLWKGASSPRRRNCPFACQFWGCCARGPDRHRRCSSTHPIHARLR